MDELQLFPGQVATAEQIERIANRMAEARIPPGPGGYYEVKPGGKIAPGTHAGTWSDYQCWLALGALRGGRGAIVQRLVSPSTVSLLGYRHEQAAIAEQQAAQMEIVRQFEAGEITLDDALGAL